MISMMQGPPRTILVFLIISQGDILKLIFPVYYRVYTYDGAIPSNSAAYSNDCSLGRISIGQISLPRTVKSLKRCIAVVEGISVDRITLYTSATIEKTIDDKTEITFDSGPGLWYSKGLKPGATGLPPTRNPEWLSFLLRNSTHLLNHVSVQISLILSPPNRHANICILQCTIRFIPRTVRF